MEFPLPRDARMYKSNEMLVVNVINLWYNFSKMVLAPKVHQDIKFTAASLRVLNFTSDIEVKWQWGQLSTHNTRLQTITYLLANWPRWMTCLRHEHTQYLPLFVLIVLLLISCTSVALYICVISRRNSNFIFAWLRFIIWINERTWHNISHLSYYIVNKYLYLFTILQTLCGYHIYINVIYRQQNYFIHTISFLFHLRGYTFHCSHRRRDENLISSLHFPKHKTFPLNNNSFCPRRKQFLCSLSKGNENIEFYWIQFLART